MARHPARTFLYIISLSGVIVVSTLALCGFMGRYWWGFDLACHFRPHYFIALTMLALALSLMKRKKEAILAALFAAPNLAVVAPLYLSGTSKPLKSPVYRAVLINVNRFNPFHERLDDFVLRADPDFVGLLEVNKKWLEDLEPLHKRYPYSYDRPRDDCYGIVLLSKHHMTSGVILDTGPYAVPAILAEVELDGQKLTIMVAHSYPPMGKLSFKHRNIHLQQLSRLAASKADPLMFMADLNTTPWSPFFSDFTKDTGLRPCRKGFGTQGTWPSYIPFFRIPIDYCLVSKNIVVRQYKIGPNVDSDHLPITVDFSIHH